MPAKNAHGFYQIPSMSKINFIIRLQRWMDSVPGQTFLNYAYSWGAAIVILGALFKLTHLPGGNTMLFIGMGTEVIVFFLSAFDRPFDKTEIGKELPRQLETDEEIERALGLSDEPAVAEEVAPSVVAPTPVVVVRTAETITTETTHHDLPTSLSEAPVAPVATTDTDTATQQPLSTATTAAIAELQDAATRAGAMALLTPDMETATSAYIDRLQALTETLSRVDEQSARLAQDNQEMERLSRTLTSINSIYELQLKGASAQISSIDQINEQTAHLVAQIEELNAVYSRMIQAMTVNARQGQ